MGRGARSEITGDEVKVLAANAGLSLGNTRAEVLVPVVNQVFGLLHGLNAVRLADTPPSFSFNSRWVE